MFEVSAMGRYLNGMLAVGTFSRNGTGFGCWSSERTARSSQLHSAPCWGARSTNHKLKFLEVGFCAAGNLNAYAVLAAQPIEHLPADLVRPASRPPGPAICPRWLPVEQQ
jgi:hypothetical protein